MCEACLEDTRRGVLTTRHLVDVLPRTKPATAAQLERHARLFGPEGIAETAAELGVTVKVERSKAARKRTKGPTLKARVVEHVTAGRSAELIAELENLSPSRARRLIEEVSA
jgi:hypothetical protein